MSGLVRNIFQCSVSPQLVFLGAFNSLQARDRSPTKILFLRWWHGVVLQGVLAPCTVVQCKGLTPLNYQNEGRQTSWWFKRMCLLIYTFQDGWLFYATSPKCHRTSIFTLSHMPRYKPLTLFVILDQPSKYVVLFFWLNVQCVKILLLTARSVFRPLPGGLP